MGNLCDKKQFLNKQLTEIKNYINTHEGGQRDCEHRENNDAEVVLAKKNAVEETLKTNHNRTEIEESKTNTTNHLNIISSNLGLFETNSSILSKVKTQSNSPLKRGSNWDNYFSEEELEYYELLYKYEVILKPDIEGLNYKKADLIGEGAFGKVYQGLMFDDDYGKFIAIKEVDLTKYRGKNYAIIDQHIKCLEKEINILSSLKHKNIVKYYGAKTGKDAVHIILEYCDVGSISKMLLSYKSFPETVIKRYTTQILEGLEYLHSHNIIHRDLKSSNILVDKNGVCKLTDFGGSKVINEELDFLQKNSFKGTPNWMAPETVKKLEYTRFSDIWSLGCTVIEMITGEPPWVDNKDYLSTLYKILHSNKPPDIPKNLSPELAHFLEYCLKMNPYERYNVHKLLKHPFITGTSLTEFINNGPSKTVVNANSSEFKSDAKSRSNSKTTKIDGDVNISKATSTKSILNLGEEGHRRASDDSVASCTKADYDNQFYCTREKESKKRSNSTNKLFSNDEITISKLNKDGTSEDVKVSTKDLVTVDIKNNSIIVEEERNNESEGIDRV